MSLVLYIALIAAALIAVRHGPGRALLAVWLPALLLLPDTFRAITPGLPDPTFGQAAMVPLLLITLLRYGARWKPRAMDLMVIAYAALVGYSDYRARGYADAQNLMFAMLFAVVGPYLVARLAIAEENLHVAVARRFVILVFAVALIGLFEFKFAYNPFIVYIGKFFPGQGTGWVTTFRHGVARVAGPYSHAILAGIMMVVAYRLQRWLHWGGHWEPRFSRGPALPWSKAQIITATLLVGTLMTVARGPWVGAVVAAAIVVVGNARDRRRALGIAGAVLLFGGLAAAWMLKDYLDIKPGTVMTMSQESAYYRKVLFEQYFDIAVDHAWFGWGLTSWPKVRGMESVDNYYLLLALMHGLPATVLLISMMLISAVQGVRRGLAEPVGVASLSFTLAGTLIAIFVSLGTVYLGEQALPTLFFLLGWSQALQVRPMSPARPGTATKLARPPPKPEFRGVIC